MFWTDPFPFLIVRWEDIFFTYHDNMFGLEKVWGKMTQNFKWVFLLYCIINQIYTWAFIIFRINEQENLKQYWWKWKNQCEGALWTRRTIKLVPRMGRGREDQTLKYFFIHLVNKYHNQSSVVFGGQNEQEDEEEKKRKELEKKKKEEELNNKLPGYDPKNGGKSNVFFGDEKPDYRRKDECHTNVKVHAPPGGRSNIQFGWYWYWSILSVLYHLQTN